MKKQNLADLCNIVIGRTPSRSISEYWGEGYPWVSISDLKTKFIGHTKEEITQIAIEKIKCRLIPKGTLLFSFKLSIGKMAFASRYLYTNEAIAGLIVKEPKKVTPEYLYYALKEAKFLGSNQAAMGKTLNSKSLAVIKVPTPENINDQIRIATLLSRVEAVINTRKDNLRLLDDFLKSTFLEMFGDPIRNNKAWDKPELVNFGKIITGNTPSRKNPENYSSNYIEWIKTDNISKDDMIISKASEYLSEIGILKARTLEANALLVACIAGSIDSIGRAALTDRKVSFNQQINAIQPNDGVNSIFLFWLFKISRVYIQSFAPRGMKKIITKGNFEKIKMIKPPIDLQNQFAIIVEKVEIIKSQYQQNLTELENLYGSLSQKAFKGELDLSRIPLPKTTECTVIEPIVEVKAEIEQAEYSIPNPETHQTLLRKLFDAFTLEQKNKAFLLDDFWQYAGNNVLEYMYEDSQALGISDYEQAKQWLFDLIESGKIKQHFIDNSKQIKLKVKG